VGILMAEGILQNNIWYAYQEDGDYRVSWSMLKADGGDG
jgi:hypothetical protein